MGIYEKIDEVKQLFLKHDQWEERYKELILLGKRLPTLSDDYKVDKYLVKGCQSQVWLYPEIKDGIVHFQADSDALIVKGIVGLLVKIYSEETPQTILETGADFLKETGIIDHLSMNRTNGLASIVKNMKLYAAAYQAMLK